MTGLYIETPFANHKNNIFFTPKLFGIFNSSQSNSNKISNEDSTDYKYDLYHYNILNRYNGTDKLDNSKRIGYGIDLTKDKYSIEFGQSYEIDHDNNDFVKKAGLNSHVSDLLGLAQYDGQYNDLIYGFRYNIDQGLMKSSSLKLKSENIFGNFDLSYIEEKKDVNSLLESGTETLDLSFTSKEFFNYSSIYGGAKFDLIEDDPTNYKIGYQYIDECFGINLDFERSFYEDRDLKPKDILTLMFSFKYLGSYSSTNLAVDHIQRQDIGWATGSVNDKKFKNIN